VSIIFNSRDINYRKPFGAINNEQNVHFKICLPRSLVCSEAILSVIDDFSGETSRFNMFWCGEKDGEEFWECHFSPKKEGLFWYCFEIATNQGRKFISRGEYSYGILSNSVVCWQLTVFKKDFKTPDWLSGGLIYQIFPDRFAKSKKEHPNIPSDRFIQENWYDIPQWQPDEFGKIRNNYYFGGDLKGIEEKLDYIKSLGVTCIYLNPIFEAHENHRYNTADYSAIDPMLGSEKDFKSLCKSAEKLGIKIVLDGVFSHTGADSRYFNKNMRYPAEGAYNTTSSPYYNWYKWENWPEKYHSWWGINTLPEIIEEEPSFLEYIAGKDGIAQKWLKAGAAGWRLDVADELPDIFLDNLRKAVKASEPNALIIGEVWEDATNKVAYGYRRRYFLGDQLDSVMNYPFKNAILGFLKGQDGAQAADIIMSVLENYPPQVIRILMNHIGTHDTERALTVLGGEPCKGRNRNWQHSQKMNEYQRDYGKALLKLASLIQYTLPGVPSLYYGDEAGIEGYSDPFNRSCYPWGKEDNELLKWYKALGELRKLPCLAEIDFKIYNCGGRLMSYIRSGNEGKKSLFVAVNAGENQLTLNIPDNINNGKVLLGKAPKGELLNLERFGYSVIEF